MYAGLQELRLGGAVLSRLRRTPRLPPPPHSPQPAHPRRPPSPAPPPSRHGCVCDHGGRVGGARPASHAVGFGTSADRTHHRLQHRFRLAVGQRVPGTEPIPRSDLGRLRDSDRGYDLRGRLLGLPRGQRGPQRPQQRGRLLSGGFVGEAAGARRGSVRAPGARKEGPRRRRGLRQVTEKRRRAWRNGNGPAARPLRVVAGADLTHRRVLLCARAAPQLAEHRPRSAGLPRGPAGPRVASRMKAPLCCGPPRSGVGRCGAQPCRHPSRRTTSVRQRRHGPGGPGRSQLALMDAGGSGEPWHRGA